MDREVPRPAVDAGAQLQPAIPRREPQGGAPTPRWQRVQLDGAHAGGHDATLRLPVIARLQRGQRQAPLRLVAQVVLTRGRVAGATFVVGGAGTQVSGGQAQLTHVVEQLAHAGVALARIGEELGEATVGLQVTPDQT